MSVNDMTQVRKLCMNWQSLDFNNPLMIFTNYSSLAYLKELTYLRRWLIKRSSKRLRQGRVCDCGRRINIAKALGVHHAEGLALEVQRNYLAGF